MGERRVRIVVDRSFPMAQVKQAYQHAEAGGFFGKVVLTMA